MSELAQLLELLYRAHASFRSVRGVLREWRDVELSHQAMWHEAEEHSRRQGRVAGRAGSAQIAFAAGPAGAEPPPQIETIVHFWLEPPDRAREEHHSTHPYGGNGVVTVRRGALWWQYDPRSGAMSNEQEPDVGSGVGQRLEQLLDPIDLLAGRDLELIGETELAGRRALDVRSRPRPSGNPCLHLLQFGAQEYRHVVDRERGILLRNSLLFQGREFGVTELTEVVFDETFPDETFILQLPEGETFASPSADRPFHKMTLEEAARRASFPLWVIPRLPEGQWRMLVVYVEPHERPPILEMVHVTYMREDAEHQLQLSEKAVGSEAAGSSSDPELETVERNGSSYRLMRGDPGQPGPPTTLFFTRGVTNIQLSSPDMPLEILLELADSLRPAG